MWPGTWSSKAWIVVYSSARLGMFLKNVVISVGCSCDVMRVWCCS